jgi:septal ring-binding cell division protein DamX
MAKKDKKGKKDKPPEASDVVDRVRGAVERTFQATSEGAGPARDMGRSLLDEVASAAQRIRESFDDLRVLEDVRGLRSEVEALSKRVAALEQQLQAAATATTSPSASAPAAAKPAASPARKPAARKPAARKPAARRAPARKPAASKSAATRSASAKPAAATSTASKPRNTRAKPASGS